MKNRRAAPALLASALLHFLALWLFEVLMPPQVEERSFRVRLPASPKTARFAPEPIFPLDRQLLERLRAESAGPRSLELEAAIPPAGATLPGVEPLPAAEDTLLVRAAAKGLWKSARDTLAARTRQQVQTGELPPALDLLELDAERRQRNIVLIDGRTHKLRRAYLHVPAYMNLPLGLQPYSGGRELAGAMEMLRRGAGVPEATPIFCEISWHSLHDPVEAPAPRDPIHAFSLYPLRHILSYEEMKQFSVLLLTRMDVESTRAMTRYLLEGGFAVVYDWQLVLLAEALQEKIGRRLQRVSIDLEHPLFHAYYDIDRYLPSTAACPGVGLLSGLEVDGRLVAMVSPPPYRVEVECMSNELYVNALAFALIQPSKMGGRYLVREPDE